MAESEISKKATKIIKVIDKFIRDLKKDYDELREITKDFNNEKKKE